MGLLCGILGKRDGAAARAMANAMAHRGGPINSADGTDFSVAWTCGKGTKTCLVDGIVRDENGAPLTPEDLRAHCRGVLDACGLGLQGTFAAVVQLGPGRWWLFRDRLGAKPLYYAQRGDSLLFASELKGLLACGLLKKHLNLLSVDRYLSLRCIPGRESIIQDVQRAPAGLVIEFAGGALTETQYASFDLSTRPMERPAAADTLRGLLEEAGATSEAEDLLWSGGLDCAALAVSRPRSRGIFVRLDRGWQEETRLARESARRLGVSLVAGRARRLNEETFGKVAACLDEPIADASVLPLWLILEEVSKHTDKAVSGHGADELLGGYPRYRLLEHAKGAKRLVPATFLSGILPALPPNAFVRRASRYLSSIHDDLGAYLSLLAVFDDGEREALYTDAMKAAIHDRGGVSSILTHHFAGADLTQNLLSLDLSVYLPDLLLTKCDRLAAAHGISLEFPYLRKSMVDFLTGLPPATKFGVRTKPLLRGRHEGPVAGLGASPRSTSIPRASRGAGGTRHRAGCPPDRHTRQGGGLRPLQVALR